MGPTTSFLKELLDLNDEKQSAAHTRLRRDLTDGMNETMSTLELHRRAVDRLVVDVEQLKTAREEERESRNRRFLFINSMAGALTSLVAMLIVFLVRKAFGF